MSTSRIPHWIKNDFTHMLAQAELDLSTEGLAAGQKIDNGTVVNV